MAKYYFYWYMNDHGPDNEADLAEAAAELVSFEFQVSEPFREGDEAPLTLGIATEILRERPFHEVKLMCEYDDMTKKVTVISASTDDA